MNNAPLSLAPCPWAKGEDYLKYHDQEWGRPCYDPHKLFEKLCLEGQQAGLSWITVLRKRAAYRQRFFNFSPARIAAMDDQEIEKALQDSTLIRHRLKLFAIRHNAHAYLALEKNHIDFSTFLWSFVEGAPIVHHYAQLAEVPTRTAASEAMSKALKKAGFRFVGPTICYAFMQSMGMVNDHLITCPCHPMHQIQP